VELQNSITLPLTPDELFEVLLDVERVAPCIPGATLEGVDGDVYRAAVHIKVGPVTAAYKGTVQFLEIDRTERRAVMKASGTETRGQGKAEATIRAFVVGDERESTLTMETDLAIRGRVAQFGRGVLNDVSVNLMNQFAENLKAQMLPGPAQEPEADAPGGDGPGPRPAAAPAGDATTAALGIEVLAAPLLKRAAPALILFLVGVLVGRRRR
jgi:carbon monoxide dehydrogenase subunit G